MKSPQGPDTQQIAYRLRNANRTPIDIPESAREVKAHFKDRPDRALVRAIAKYISETGLAHLHPAVTYAPIETNTEVHFLQKFSLSEKFKSDQDRWCVCAACRHDFPKFKNDGVICWIPSEYTIKVVGWHCFRSHSPDAHAEAEARYVSERKARQVEVYLLKLIPLVPSLRVDLMHDLEVAQALHDVRAKFHAALIAFNLQDIERHMRKGELRIVEERTQYSHGSGTAKRIQVKIDFATVEGIEFVNRTGGAVVEDLLKARRALQSLDFGETWIRIVDLMPDKEKEDWARRIGEAIKNWNEARKTIDRMRQFLGPQSGKTIQSWSRQTHAPVRFFFEYHEHMIHLGADRNRFAAIEIPTMAREPLSRPQGLSRLLK